MPFILRRSFIEAAMLLVIVQCASRCRGQEPLDGFDKYAVDALAAFGTPGMAVAVVKEGEVVSTRGYGLRKLGGDAPVDDQTVFHIASISKTFTATAIAILVDEGKLKWDDPVVKHYPEFQLSDSYRAREATITDLLAHRLGIENDELVPARGDVDRTKLIRRMRFLRPVAGFRSTYSYQDTSYVVLSEIVRRVSGISWEDFVKQRIFKPLGMTSSSLEVDSRDRLKNLATMYALIEGDLQVDTRWINGEPEPPWHKFAETAAPEGGVHANVQDMARYMAMYLGRGERDGVRLLKPQTVDSTFALRSSVPIVAERGSKLPSARMFWGGGLGWQVRDYRSHKQVLHGGSAGSVVVMMPDDGLGIVVLSNRAGLGLPIMVAYELVDRYLGLKSTATIGDWVADVITEPQKEEDERWRKREAARKSGTSPSLPLAGYTGEYTSDLFGAATVRQEGDGLVFELGPNFHIRLEHWQDDTFHAKFPMRWRMEWFVKFSAIRGGRAERFEPEQIFADGPLPTFQRVHESAKDGQPKPGDK